LLGGFHDEVVRALCAERKDRGEATVRGCQTGGTGFARWRSRWQPNKQRVARAGGGRSGGFGTLIAYHARRRSVFLYGFAKSERDNIDDKELADLKKLAKRFLSLTEGEIETALDESELKELPYDGEEED
jgi:hypothetical protein